MKSRNVLILALIMALVTTLLFNKYLKDLDSRYKKNVNKLTVVTAKVPIKKNQKVTKEMLQLKEVTSDAVLTDAVKKFEEIEGKCALTDIKAGEILLPFRFTSQFEESEEITRKIRDGYRAVSIEANFVESVSNLIKPEDYVDIVYTETIKESGGNNQVNTSLVLENVRVLAVGNSINEDKGEGAAKDSKDKNQAAQYTAVTVELKPEDSVKIINVDEKGNIKFILRSKVVK